MSEQIQNESQRCGPMWTDVNMGAVSLTELQGMPGANEPVDDCGSSLHGAEFMEIKHMASPHYERLMTQVVPVPWLAQREEATYMNVMKAANEPRVETYRQLELSAPIENYGQVENFENYEQVGNSEQIEGFGGGGYDLFFKVLLVICLLAFIYYIMKEMK